MKRSEKEALLKAFNIPEPERKAAFVSEFNEKSKDKKPVILMSRIFRYSSVAAVLALALGIAGHFTLSRDFGDKFNKNEHDPPPVTAVVTTTAPSESTTDTVTTSLTTVTTAVTESGTVTVTEVKTSSGTTAATAANTSKTTVGTSTTSTRTEIRTTSTANVTTSSAVASTVLSTTTTTRTTKPRTSVTTTQTTKAKVTTTTTQTTKPKVTTTTTIPKPTGSKTNSSRVTTTLANDYYPDTTTTYPLSTSIVQSSTSWAGGDNTGAGPNSPFEYDFTVSCDTYYYPETMDNVITVMGVGGGDPQFNTYFNKLWDGSDYVVRARVIDIKYTSFEHKPYTQCDIEVVSKFRGSFYERDKVSLFFRGGYIPAWEYDMTHGGVLDSYSFNDFVLDYSGGCGLLPEINEDYIFFFRLPDIYGDDECPPGGGYIPTERESVSVFVMHGDDCISLGDPDVTFDLKDLVRRKEEW